MGKSKKKSKLRAGPSFAVASSSSSAARAADPTSVVALAKKGFLRRILPFLLTANLAVGGVLSTKPEDSQANLYDGLIVKIEEQWPEALVIFKLFSYVGTNGKEPDLDSGELLKWNSEIEQFISMMAVMEPSERKAVKFSLRDYQLGVDKLEEDERTSYVESDPGGQSEKLLADSIKASTSAYSKKTVNPPLQSIILGSTSDKPASKEGDKPAATNQPRPPTAPLRPCYQTKGSKKEFSTAPFYQPRQFNSQSLGEKPKEASLSKKKIEPNGELDKKLEVIYRALYEIQAVVEDQQKQIAAITQELATLKEEGAVQPKKRKVVSFTVAKESSAKQRMASTGGDDVKPNADFVQDLNKILNSFSAFDSKNNEAYKSLCRLLKGMMVYKMIDSPELRFQLTSRSFRDKLKQKVFDELEIDDLPSSSTTGLLTTYKLSDIFSRK